MTFVTRPPKGSTTDNATKVDGRRLRSERTERLIVEAYMALVREIQQVPTAAQIAERAGYSVRSVFERFPDLNAIRVAAIDHAIAESLALNVPIDLNADLQARLRMQVETRGRGCERWLPLWRVLNTDRGESAELDKRIRMIRELIILRIETVFKRELSVLPELPRRHIVLAIEALVDFESWGRMRDLYGLSFDEACSVWIRAIGRLLPPTPPGA
jgi:AcrR family transcriptional regulator